MRDFFLICMCLNDSGDDADDNDDNNNDGVKGDNNKEDHNNDDRNKDNRHKDHQYKDSQNKVDHNQDHQNYLFVDLEFLFTVAIIRTFQEVECIPYVGLPPVNVQ